MRNLSTTVAVYADLATAEADWNVIEVNASEGIIDLADAALVTRGPDGTTTLRRQSHHGWGKGAVAGAVVGLLFPASLLGGAVVGASGGALVARLNRSLDRGDIKELGEAMDSGTSALVVLTSESTAAKTSELLTSAKKKVTKASSTAEDVMAAIEGTAPQEQQT